MARDRGIEHIEEITGDFLDIISKRIAKKGKVKILEAGCGHGVAMAGFVKRFGDKIEIIGFNLNKNHGTIDKMRTQSIAKEIFTEEQFAKIRNLPKIVYCDGSKKLPFKSNSFDFIYSRAAVYLFDNKVNFFEECNRILKKDGIARVAPGFWSLGTPPGNEGEPYGIEIYDNGIRTYPEKYFNKIKGVKLLLNKNHEELTLEIKKTKDMKFNLRFVASIDYNYIWYKWMGIKSIYSTELKFKPHWKQ
ncbi:class I SAM-dependent methyltransferase [Candidatus Pacearchaeota archaeon]|nr:class I SAM-dependent methyltransferase [Candidatus Pacearchaeota archaeon]